MLLVLRRLIVTSNHSKKKHLKIDLIWERDALNSCVCVAERASRRMMGSFAASTAPKNSGDPTHPPPNQIHLTPDSLMWGWKPRVVVVIVVIFVCGSGEGFRYFHATHLVKCAASQTMCLDANWIVGLVHAGHPHDRKNRRVLSSQDAKNCCTLACP